ncbi:FRG domain-containing protein [Marinomonas sp. 5E14-1]|uniref:FRG domain-containing protein n=1 Tax=Marinomonas sp. 5E14-1 TaxID=3153922 RepID=UPI0032646403
MDTSTLKNLEQLHLFFRTYRSHNGVGSWFRGQANVEWNLIPKAGRDEYFLPNHRDLGRFYDWEKQAIAYQALPKNLVQSLALAQHHGLATRLLDWTQNPLVAAYFAVSTESNCDGAIYILEPLETFIKDDITREQLIELNGVACYFPRAISPRLLNQQGMFTVHSPANSEIEITKSRLTSERTNIIKIIIPRTLKKELEEMISDYGINSSMIFPDLDGLSQHKNRQTESMVTRRKT